MQPASRFFIQWLYHAAVGRPVWFEALLHVLQAMLKALLQDRKAAETTKQAKAAKLSLSVRAWARLKAFILLILLLYTIPGEPCLACSMQVCEAANQGVTQEDVNHRLTLEGCLPIVV